MLNFFLDCPRCFWFDKVRNIKRPRGIFPSLRDSDGSILSGALDDLLVKDGQDIPFDYKTKGSLPEMNGQCEYCTWLSKFKNQS